MRFTDNHARPVVLRELSLLRALGTSLRTFSHRRLRYTTALPLAPSRRQPDAFALLPGNGPTPTALMPDKRP